jgi:hypothetical protein
MKLMLKNEKNILHYFIKTIRLKKVDFEKIFENTKKIFWPKVDGTIFEFIF